MLNLETFVKLIGGPGIEKNCFKSKHSAVQLRKKKKVLASKKKKKKKITENAWQVCHEKAPLTQC